MTIQFTSDGIGVAPGFEGSWICGPAMCTTAPPPPPDFSECTGTFFDTGGAFGDYNNNANEVYSVCPTDPFTCLSVTIVQYDIENGFDNLFIYNGPTIGDPLLGNLTGTGSNITIEAPNCITLQFTSDGSVTNPGWEATWACSNDPCAPNGSSVDPPDLTDCTGTIEDSGGLGGNYLNQENWEYSICPTDPHQCIILDIDNYDISTDGDLLTIYETASSSGPVLGQLTGSGSGLQFQAASGCMTIAFSSNLFGSAGGWSGSFSCSSDPCTIPVPIDVTSNVPENALTDLISSPGVIVNNVQLNCPGGAYGTFETYGISEIGIQSGIILTNGSAEDAEGPNDNAATGTDLGLPGDPTLDPFVVSPFPTQDACELQFQVYAATSLLSFDYVFGSEEYPEFINSAFNDVFAFFISGPGIVGEQNIALVPGTTLPVAIENINCQNNDQYFICAADVPNSLQCPTQCNSNGISVQYDGFTTPLTAIATVIPCNFYTLRLVIADAGGDGQYDSGVFIAANSLTTGIATINPEYEFEPDLDYTIEGCASVTFTVALNGPETDTTTIYLDYQGTATNGVDFDMLPDSVVFPPGITEIDLTILPNLDGMDEGIEEAIIYVLSNEGCGDIQIDSAVIEIRDFIPIEVSPDSTICFGDTIQLEADGALSYSWSPDDDLDDPLIYNPTVIPAETTTYVVTGEVGNCQEIDSVEVTVIDTRIDLLPNADTVYICAGGSIELTASNPSGQTGFVWSPATGLDDPNIPNPTASPTMSTDYMVSLAVGDCESIRTIHVEVLNSLPLNVIPDSTICEGEAIVLADNIIGPNYTWVPSTYLDDPNTANPVATPLNSITYKVYTESSGCLDSTEVEITVINTPTVEAGLDQDICLGESAQLQALSSIGGNFTWTPAATLSNPFLPNPVATPTSSTTYTVSFTDQGCIITDSVRVNVGLPITLSPIPDSTICFGDTIMLGATIIDMANTYTWSPMDGLVDASDPNTMASPSSTTTYTLSATNGVCVKDTTITITVTPDLDVDAGNDAMLCIGQSIQLQSTVAALGGTYVWTPSTDLDDPNLPNPTATPMTTTTYMLSYAIGECTDSDTVRIEVRTDVPVSAISDTTLCIGQSVIIGNNTALPGVTYTWTPSTGLDDPMSANPIATPTDTTLYKLIATNGSCTDSVEVLVNVVNDLSVTADEDVTICDGESISINANGMNGTTYNWIPIDGLSCTDCPSPVATPDTTTTYTVEYYQGDCVETDEITVFVAGGFSLNVSNDTIINQGDVVMISANPVADNTNPIGEITYEWSSTIGLSEPNNPATEAAPLETITYTVLATSSSGCTATASVNIVVNKPEFGTPNAFSPNNDGLNDLFNIETRGNIEVETFKIFDRWGELVFDNSDPNGWDGRFEGELMPMDVYVYYAVLVFPDNTRQRISGDVTLIR